MDAFATPFVQGRLRNREVSIQVETSCAHCGRDMHLTIDHDMNCASADPGSRPIIFVPKVDMKKLKDPSIIDAF